MKPFIFFIETTEETQDFVLSKLSKFGATLYSKFSNPRHYSDYENAKIKGNKILFYFYCYDRSIFFTVQKSLSIKTSTADYNINIAPVVLGTGEKTDYPKRFIFNFLLKK